MCVCSVAIRSGCVDLVKLLLLQGAKVDQEGRHGRRPLHEAARLGKAATVALLLEAGAHPDPRSHYGLTPLALAAQAGHLEVVEALLARGEGLGAWAEGLPDWSFSPHTSSCFAPQGQTCRPKRTMTRPSSTRPPLLETLPSSACCWGAARTPTWPKTQDTCRSTEWRTEDTCSECFLSGEAESKTLT